jgi:hypothetical protein
VLLISVPAVVVAAVQQLRTQSWRRALGYGVLAALLAAIAVAVAVWLWVVSRCGD